MKANLKRDYELRGSIIDDLRDEIIRKNDLLRQAAIALKQTGTCKAVVAAIEKELNPK